MAKPAASIPVQQIPQPMRTIERDYPGNTGAPYAEGLYAGTAEGLAKGNRSNATWPRRDAFANNPNPNAVPWNRFRKGGL